MAVVQHPYLSILDRLRLMWARAIGWGVLIVVTYVAVSFAHDTWRTSKLNPATDDASVTAPIVTIVSSVPGTIIEVAVSEAQQVKKGDLLFKIDPTPYALEVAQAQAVLATAQSELRQGEGNILFLQSNADVAAQQINRAEHNLKWAQATLARLEPLLAKQYVTAQEVDTARTAVRDAMVTLEQSRAAASGSQAAVGTLDSRLAQVELATASLRLAERNLAHTEVLAPRDGLISGLKLTSGDFVISAQALFSLIDNSEWKISALYRETDLPNIKIGASARVFLLSAPDLELHGTVTSIGWGIRSTDEANILGLPLVSSSLNWVRSAKRYPVEIKLENAPADLTRIGATASVRVMSRE